jgi:hypothetical protein
MPCCKPFDSLDSASGKRILGLSWSLIPRVNRDKMRYEIHGNVANTCRGGKFLLDFGRWRCP